MADSLARRELEGNAAADARRVRFALTSAGRAAPISSPT